MYKTIEDYELKGKRVIIRCDFNVPIKDGVILADNRIKASLKTINYAINNGAKVILMSHLGKVKTEEDKEKLSLKPVAVRLSQLLNKEVIFIGETRGAILNEKVNDLKESEVLLIENTRFEDISEKKESSNNSELSSYWALLGDIFINDAFGTLHRAHASNTGIAEILPNGIGYLVKKEIDVLEETLNNCERPFVVILGGAKVSSKIGIIENLLSKADKILIGGGMAYTFLKARGYNIGKSLVDLESIDFCKKILEKYPNKIVLPIDVITGLEVSEDTLVNIKDIKDIRDNEIGLDIGPKTIVYYEEILKYCKTVIANGPLGLFEIDKFANGTKKILEILKNSDAKVIIGGGDTASAAINFGYSNDFYHISTGGGATLEYLEGKELPGIKFINRK